MKNLSGIIVLEGPDAAGKTTLARYLHTRYGARYLHQIYRWKDQMFTYHTAALHLAIRYSAQQLVVLDRLWASENIYAAEFRGGSKWPYLGRMIDRVLLRYGAINVLCLPELDNYSYYFDKVKTIRQEQYEDIQGVVVRYHALWCGGIIYDRRQEKRDYVGTLAIKGVHARQDWLRYDFTSTKMEDFAEVILQRVRSFRDTFPGWALDLAEDNLIGSIATARFLFVGDRVNQRFRVTSWPFYSDQGCAVYFATILDQLCFDERAGCWVNINQKNGVQLITRILAWRYEMNLPITIIVLGKAARRTFQAVFSGCDSNMDIYVVEHPQYVKRFKYHHSDRYLQTLGEIFAGTSR